MVPFMTFDQLRYFLETAKFEHLGKASLSLHISPSAVSAAISALEDEFAVTLFERQGKGIRLSEKGRFLRGQLEKIFDELAKVRSTLGQKDAALAGTYRIGASPFLAAHFLAKLWAKLQDRHPEVVLEISSVATANVLSGLINGSLDGGLCFSPLKHPSLKATELYKGELRIAVRKGHPIFKKRVGERLKLLNQFPATIHKAVPGVDICEDHPMFEKFGIRPSTPSLWDSDDVGLEIIRCSDAWSLLPDLVVQQNAKDLVALDLPSEWQAPYFIGFVVQSHRAENSFLNFLMAELQEQLH
jgi:DNA-binding transcriptional LysR family regulator